jgi:hypothetical protein
MAEEDADRPYASSLLVLDCLDRVPHNNRVSIFFEKASINGDKVQSLIEGPLCDGMEKKGHKGQIVVSQSSHKGNALIDNCIASSMQGSSGLSKILGLDWKRLVGVAPILGATVDADRKFFFARIMAGGDHALLSNVLGWLQVWEQVNNHVLVPLVSVALLPSRNNPV